MKPEPWQNYVNIVQLALHRDLVNALWQSCKDDTMGIQHIRDIYGNVETFLKFLFEPSFVQNPQVQVVIAENVGLNIPLHKCSDMACNCKYCSDACN